MCLYCVNARSRGKFEWPKTLQGSQIENFRDYLSLGVRKPKNMYQTTPTSLHVVFGGFQEKSFSLLQKQTLAHSVVRFDWNFKRDQNLWSDETKKAFWQQTHLMCLVQTGIKSTPCLRLNILLDLLCYNPIFLLEVLHLTWYCGF